MIAPTLALKFWNSLSVGARRYRTRAGFFFLAIFTAPATAGRRGTRRRRRELGGRICFPPARQRLQNGHPFTYLLRISARASRVPAPHPRWTFLFSDNAGPSGDRAAELGGRWQQHPA